MTVEISKHASCVKEPQGIIAILIICLGYLKYLVVTLLIIIYCAYFRRFRVQLSEVDIQHNVKKTQEFLMSRIAQMPENEACSICMDTQTEAVAVGLECGHFFHLQCLNDWVSIKGSCPMCRQRVLITPE